MEKIWIFFIFFIFVISNKKIMIIIIIKDIGCVSSSDCT